MIKTLTITDTQNVYGGFSVGDISSPADARAFFNMTSPESTQQDVAPSSTSTSGGFRSTQTQFSNRVESENGNAVRTQSRLTMTGFGSREELLSQFGL